MNLIKTNVNWKYYNHSLIPTCNPDENPDLSILNDINKWKAKEGMPFIIRWTSNYDSRIKTNFWYIVKDKPFDMVCIKSHYRNKIRKGCLNFEVRKIEANAYKDKLVYIQEKAFTAYDKGNEGKVHYKPFEDATYFGAFNNNELCGYIVCFERDKCIYLNSMRTIPSCEKLYISEALVFNMLDYYKDDLNNGKYICDGSRSVSHQTNFQDFLETKFNFRKAYCKLHIVYNPLIKPIIYVLYPIRKIIKNSKIHGLLLMHEIMIKDKGIKDE